MQAAAKKERPESAFPWQRYTQWEDFDFGMTLRDYFAAKAMQGMLAESREDHEPIMTHHAEKVAEIAYIFADAMLKAREGSAQSKSPELLAMPEAIVGTIEDHDIESLDCDNTDNIWCNCLSEQVKKAKALIAEAK